MPDLDAKLFIAHSTPEQAKRQLRLILALFLLALTFPIYLLFSRVYRQLENETLFQYRTVAEEVVGSMGRKLQAVLKPEDVRSFDEYSFFNLGNVPLQQGQGLTLSPLAQYPPKTAIPGIVGYFQVNPDGSLQTPTLPNLEGGVISGLSPEDLARRIAAWDRLYQILANEERPIEPAPMPAPPASMSGPTKASSSPAAASDSSGSRRSNSVLPPPAAARPLAEMSEGEIAEIVVGSRNLAQQLEPERLLKKEGRFENAQQLADLNLDAKYLERQPKPKAFAQSKKLEPEEQALRSRRKEKVSIPVSSESIPFDRGSDDAQQKPEPVQEEDILPDAQAPSLAGAAASTDRQKGAQAGVRMLTLEGEVDPFQFRILDNVHLLFLRKVWREGRRYLQGFVLESEPFFKEVFSDPFLGSSLSQASTMIVGYQGVFFRRVSAMPNTLRSEKEIVLYRASLDAPFDSLEVLITTPELTAGAGGQVVNALAYALVAVLLGGLYGIYRLGLRQIIFAKERSDFVSAVSHELKTPLTSIRMYSEMLRSGWVHDEEKKRSYYDYIFTESERLSRLIANVLQFAKLSNSNSGLELKALPAEELLELAVSKVRSQVEQAGFILETECVDRRADGSRVALNVDIEEDAFCRIAINLVDNALKFSGKTEDRRIVLALRLEADEAVFSVRDFGTGVPREEMKKIFQLFYRAEDEMKRSTPGTGIGLALVKELASKMGATIDLKNQNPGAEFFVTFSARISRE